MQEVDITPGSRDQILPLREQFLEELDDFSLYEGRIASDGCRFFLLRCNERSVGYAAIGERGSMDKTILEFYLMPAYRPGGAETFRSLIDESGASHVVARSNDALLSALLWEHCEDLHVRSLHFRLVFSPTLPNPGLTWRPAEESDLQRLHQVFSDPECRPFHWTDDDLTKKYLEEDSFVVFESGENLVGVGVMYRTVFQPRYVDLGMVVAPGERQKGYGSFIVQETTRECLSRNLKPAVGCSSDNVPSRRTLERAGYFPYDRYIRGSLVVRTS